MLIHLPNVQKSLPIGATGNRTGEWFLNQPPNGRIQAKLVEDAKSVRQQADAGTHLGGDLGIRFQHHKVDTELLEDAGKSEARYAASGNNDLEVFLFHGGSVRELVRAVLGDGAIDGVRGFQWHEEIDMVGAIQKWLIRCIYVGVVSDNA